MDLLARHNPLYDGMERRGPEQNSGTRFGPLDWGLDRDVALPSILGRRQFRFQDSGPRSCCVF